MNAADLPLAPTPRQVGRRAGFALLLAALVGAPLALGGVFTEAITASAVACLAAVALVAFSAHQPTIDGFGVLLLGLAAATSVQMVPLPEGAVAALSPRTHEIVMHAAAALGEPPPTAFALSLDPPSTALMLAWMLALAAGHITARKLSQREHDRVRIVLTVPMLGLVVLGIGLAHAILGLDRIYGVHEVPPGASPSVTGAIILSSFVNPNHLAAFLALGVPIAVTQMGAADTGNRARVLHALTAVALLVGVVLTGSRAGVATALLTALLAALARDRRPGRTVLLAGAAVVIGVVLVTPLGEQLAGLPGLSSIIEATDRGVRTVGVEAIKTWPLVGVGRGAFPVAQTVLNSGLSGFTVTHAHNTPIQVVADYGVVIGGVAVVASVVLLGRAALQAFGTPVARGAALALLGLGLHNLVDFSLDILGVALPAAALCGAVRAGTQGIRLPGRALGVAAGLMAVGVGVMAARIGPEPGSRRDARITEAPLEAARRHPADAYAFFAAGVAERRLELLDHARYLAPYEPRLPLAEAALKRGDARFDGIREALALPGAYRVRTQAFTLLQRSARSGAELVRGLPDGAHAAAYLAWLRPPNAAAAAAILAGFPEAPEVLEHVARQRLTAKDWEGLADVATRLMALEAPSGYRYMAQVYEARGKAWEAVQLFALAGDGDSLLQGAELALRSGDPARALSVLDGAKVPASALKRLRTVESRAREAIAAGVSGDLSRRAAAEVRPGRTGGP